MLPDDASLRSGPFMTAADTPRSTEPLLLLALAGFTKFTAYLENSAADPRLSHVQTAFTRHAGGGLPLPGPLAARPTLPMLVRIAPEIPALLRLTASTSPISPAYGPWSTPRLDSGDQRSAAPGDQASPGHALSCLVAAEHQCGG
jgi:hypothetical protein